MSNRSMRNRWSYGLAVAAVIFVPLVTPSRSYGEQPAPQRARPVGVIPDTHGAIAEILVHYDPDISSDLAPVYRDLFGALPDDVRVKVLAPTAAAADDFIQLWEWVLHKRSVDVINVGLPMSIWARDRCIARQSLDLANPAFTFVPIDWWGYEPVKSNDLLLQDILYEAHLAPRVMNSPLYVEGGNVVSNSRHVFVGSNVLFENSDISASRLEFELSRLLGRSPLIVGDKSGDVPWCHIDMYLTPVSDDTLLVASLRYADMLLGAPEDCDEDTDHWKSLTGTDCFSDTLQEQLDAVAAEMRQIGYRVHRIPAVADLTNQWMMTYNNILIDERDGRRTVYMPVYGMPPLDETAAAIYRGLGFEVRTVDVSQVYDLGGALRCMVNVTRRRGPNGTFKTGNASDRIRLVDLAGNQSFDGILDRCRDRLARRSHRNTWSTESLP